MPSHVKRWMIARQRRRHYAQMDTILFPPRLEQVTRRQEEELAARLKIGCSSSVKHHLPESLLSANSLGIRKGLRNRFAARGRPLSQFPDLPRDLCLSSWNC